MIRIDMSMPTNCLECPACNEYLTCAIPINGRKWKAKDVREFDQGRPEWCPMEEEEQEAVEPRNIYSTTPSGKVIPRIFCGKCNKEIYAIYAFCPFCGQAVKWE